jgi:ribonuclease HI
VPGQPPKEFEYVPLPQIYAEGGLVLYTDGSCAATDRVGGWAWVAVDVAGQAACNAMSAVDTTISRMELTAAWDGLEEIWEIHGPCTVLVISDSEYVVLGVQNPTRKRNANVDLWIGLDEAIRKHTVVEFMHTRGHAGDPGNEEADRLAGEFRRAALHDALRET